MICNLAECVRNNRSPWYCPRTGRSSKEKYVSNKLSLPKGEVIQAQVVEVLRKAEQSQVARGRWIDGNAWIGSVNSCVKLMKKKGSTLYSSWSKASSTAQQESCIQFCLPDIKHDWQGIGLSWRVWFPALISLFWFMHTQTNAMHILLRPVGQQCDTVPITNLATKMVRVILYSNYYLDLRSLTFFMSFYL